MAKNDVPPHDENPDESRAESSAEDAQTREYEHVDRSADTQNLEPVRDDAPAVPVATRTTTRERLRPFAIPAAVAAGALVIGGIGGFGIAQATSIPAQRDAASAPLGGQDRSQDRPGAGDSPKGDTAKDDPAKDDAEKNAPVPSSTDVPTPPKGGPDGSTRGTPPAPKNGKAPQPPSGASRSSDAPTPPAAP